MASIKLKIENDIDFREDQRVFSNIVHLAFNRFKDGLSEKDVRAYLRPLFEGVNSWFLQNAVKVGLQTFERFKNEKSIIFGGKWNLVQYLKKRIDKKIFKENRLSPIVIQGEKLRGGNRFFNFDLPNNEVTFKPSRKDHRTIKFCTPHRSQRETLIKLQELIDKGEATVTVTITKGYVILFFDDNLIKHKKLQDLKKNRVLGIDMNPNYLGISVLEFDKNDNFKVLHKEVIDLTLLTKKSKEASSSKKSKYFVNKLHHETIQNTYEIVKIADYWKCSKVVIEDLSMKHHDSNKGREYNRLTNNIWNRGLFSSKLESLSKLFGFELVKVNPAYSSFIGNVVYGNETTPDMVAASIEIGRRGYKKFFKGWFYPSIEDERIDEQWKQTLSGFKTWVEAFNEIKNSGVKYRVQLKDVVLNAVFSKIYGQRKLIRY